MAITPAVQKSAQALRVLCRIYDLCLDFCEVDWAEGSNHLRLLAGAAAAALFGSYYQSERDTLHDTAYAMDELARISSFALSHILLSKSSIIPDATKILGNRIPSLLTVLFFAPELSIQRSIILVLRLLHDHAGDLECNVHRDLQRKIENGLSDTRFGNGAGLQVFKEFDVQSDTSETQAESIIAKMLDEVDIISKCFTCNCTVQMKGKVNGRTKKGGSVKAQVDWNKNSIVVHVKNQAPAYFPFHNISTMKWMSGHKEVRLGFRSNSELSDTQLTVRFGPGNRAFLGRAIENRIEQVISSVSQKHSSVDHTEALHPLRKASVSYHMFNTFGTTSSCEDDDQDCTDQESDVFERSDVQCEADDVVPRKENDGSYSESITGRSPVKQVPPNKDSGGALETSRPSRGRKTARNVGVKQKCHSPASGITEEAQDYGESQERSPTPSSQCRMDADGAHVSLPRVCAGNEKKCAPDSTLARDMEICADIDITKRRKTAEDGDTHRHAKLTQSNLDACEELRRSSSEQSIASTPPDIVSNQLAKSEDIGSDTHESGDIVMSISEKPKVAKPVRNERKLPSMTFKQHTGFQKKAVASSNNSGSESTVVSIQSSRINSSETKFSAADERVRIKLLCVVHEVTKVSHS